WSFFIERLSSVGRASRSSIGRALASTSRMGAIINSNLKIGVFYFMANCYILYSEKLDKYYVGACIDLARRSYEHNIGHSKFTSTGTPWVLKYEEEFPDLAAAKKREAYIK